MEAEAKSISQFSTQVVPGLLQTRAYAEAVLADVYRSAPKEALRELANIRMGRQAVLAPDRVDAPPLALHVVLNEAALYRGPRSVLRDQLEYLITAAARSNVTLQVFRFQDGFTEARSVMTIFRPNEEGDWPVVNIEGAGHDPFYDDDEDIETFERLWSELASTALDETGSKQIVDQLARAERGWRAAVSDTPQSNDPDAPTPPTGATPPIASDDTLLPAGSPASHGAVEADRADPSASPAAPDPCCERTGATPHAPTTFYELVWLAIDRLCALIDRVLDVKEAQPFLRLFAVLVLIGLVVVLITCL